MSKDGASSNSLSERLAAKLEAERLEIEAMTSKELQALGAKLSSVSQSVLSSMQNDIARQVESMTPRLLVALRPIFWMIGCCVFILIASLILLWGENDWKGRQLTHLYRQIAIEQQNLKDLKSQTGGVSVHKSGEGYLLVLPEMVEKTFYTCNNKNPCIKLPE